MSTKVHVIFYSMYGHVWRMAEAVAAGAREVGEVEVGLYQVSELVPDAILEQSGAKKARAQFAQIPFATLEQLSDADAIIFGTPTRFGNMAAQMRQFPRSDWRPVDAGRFDQQDWQCFHQHGIATRWTGNDNYQFSYDTVTSRDDRGRDAILGARAVEHGRDNRRHAVWRFDHYQGRRKPPAERERT